MKTLTNYITLLLICLAMGLGSACEIVDDEPKQKLENLFTSKAPQVQSYQLDAENGGQITTDHGVNIVVYPGAFTDVNGDRYEGPVKLEIKEVFTIPEMIFSGVLPVGYNRLGRSPYPIESDGQFFIRATQAEGNGILNLYKNGIYAEVPRNSSNPNMRLYTSGQAIDADTIRWEIDTTNFILPGDTFGNDTIHRFNINKFNWINCDAPFLRDYTRVKVELSYTGSKLDVMKAFLVFRQANSVYHFSDHVFNTDQTLVIFGYRGEDLFYDIVDIAPPIDQVISLDMKQTTRKELQELIEKLQE